MKVLILLLIGGVLGALTLRLYEKHEAEQHALIAGPAADKNRPDAPSLSDKARETAGDVRDAVSDKLAEWHLTPDDIKDDLAKTGEVVRTKTLAAGEKISDARIVTVIKAKYVIDRDLSAIDIVVGSNDGMVTLGGTVASTGLIGKAIVIALDTDGVRGVTSKLAVAAK